MSSPAAVICAELGAGADPELDRLLGALTAGIVRDELARRARRWAAAVAPGAASEATGLEAAGAALHGHEGPVLLAAPDVPGLDLGLAAAALADLAAGVRAVVAPTWDGATYLVGLPDASPASLALAGLGFEALVAAADGEVGMLRAERRLVGPADARAVAADPLTPLELGLPLAAGGLRVRMREG